MLSYIITYGLMLFCYSLYLSAVIVGARSGSQQLKDVLSGKGDTGILFSRLLAGILFLGVGGIGLFEQRELDISIIDLTWNANFIVWTLTAAAIITGIVSTFKKPAQNNSIQSLPFRLSLPFILTRTLFLIMYEFFFRGVMLFIMIEDMGIVIAIVFNIVFYMLTHWFNMQERYGSLIMGTVLCGVAIYYHSVWPAIIIHFSLALSYEITQLIKHKSSVKKSWL